MGVTSTGLFSSGPKAASKPSTKRKLLVVSKGNESILVTLTKTVPHKGYLDAYVLQVAVLSFSFYSDYLGKLRT